MEYRGTINSGEGRAGLRLPLGYVRHNLDLEDTSNERTTLPRRFRLLPGSPVYFPLRYSAGTLGPTSRRTPRKRGVEGTTLRALSSFLRRDGSLERVACGNLHFPRPDIQSFLKS